MSLATLMLPRRRRPAPPRPAPALRVVIRRSRLRLLGDPLDSYVEVYLPGWDWRLHDGDDPVDMGHVSTWLAARAQALDALEHWSHAA